MRQTGVACEQNDCMWAYGISQTPPSVSLSDPHLDFGGSFLFFLAFFFSVKKRHENHTLSSQKPDFGPRFTQISFARYLETARTVLQQLQSFGPHRTVRQSLSVCVSCEATKHPEAVKQPTPLPRTPYKSPT